MNNDLIGRLKRGMGTAGGWRKSLDAYYDLCFEAAESLKEQEYLLQFIIDTERATKGEFVELPKEIKTVDQLREWAKQQEVES